MLLIRDLIIIVLGVGAGVLGAAGAGCRVMAIWCLSVAALYLLYVLIMTPIRSNK